MPFALWSDEDGLTQAVTYAPQLLAHFHASLSALEVPLNVKDGFELVDVTASPGVWTLLARLQQAPSCSVMVWMLLLCHMELWCGNCKPESFLTGRGHGFNSCSSAVGADWISFQVTPSCAIGDHRWESGLSRYNLGVMASGAGIHLVTSLGT